MSRWLLTAGLMAMATSLISAADDAKGLPPLIPRTVLFGNPVKASPQISPDGKKLSFLAPDKNNVLQVWVQTIGQDDAKPVTADKKRGIRTHMWTYAPDTLLYLQDNDGAGSVGNLYSPGISVSSRSNAMRMVVRVNSGD